MFQIRQLNTTVEELHNLRDDLDMWKAKVGSRQTPVRYFQYRSQGFAIDATRRSKTKRSRVTYCAIVSDWRIMIISPSAFKSVLAIETPI